MNCDDLVTYIHHCFTAIIQVNLCCMQVKKWRMLLEHTLSNSKQHIETGMIKHHISVVLSTSSPIIHTMYLLTCNEMILQSKKLELPSLRVTLTAF